VSNKALNFNEFVKSWLGRKIIDYQASKPLGTERLLILLKNLSQLPVIG
jgi:hypothetical protein